MKKSSKSTNVIKGKKLLNRNLRKRSLSNGKNNIEKMLAHLKKEIIGGISTVIEDIINQHKTQIIKVYNKSPNKQITPEPEKEEKKLPKSKKSKKIKENISNEINDVIENDENEEQYDNNIAFLTPKDTKTKKAKSSSKKSQKKKGKKSAKKNIRVAIEREKTEPSSYNEIAKINETDPKLNKKERNENEQLVNENLSNTLIIGKKTKRGKVSYTLFVGPDNKNELEDKKPKRSISKRKPNSTTKKVEDN